MNNDSLKEKILSSLPNDIALISALSAFNLRTFYKQEENELYIAWNVADLTKIKSANARAYAYSGSSGKITCICADTEYFAITIDLYEKDNGDYTYSKIFFHDKNNNKRYDIKNKNIEEEPKTVRNKIVKSINKFVLKLKK